jgi:hypothetical protein
VIIVLSIPALSLEPEVLFHVFQRLPLIGDGELFGVNTLIKITELGQTVLIAA